MAYTDALAGLRRSGAIGRFGENLLGSKRPGMIGTADWEDPEWVTTELERLKQRNREINMSANPAFGGTGGMGVGGGGIGGVSPFASTPQTAKAGGNTNVEFWENNEKIRALEELASGGVGSAFRTKRAPIVTSGTPASLAYSSNAPMEGEEAMPGQGLAALQRQTSQGQAAGGGYSNRDWEARMAHAALRRAEAEAAGAEGVTPLGQREAAEAATTQAIGELQRGRTRLLATGTTGIAQDVARQKAISEAETFGMPALEYQRGVEARQKLEEIRAGKVEPANIAGYWRAGTEGIRQQATGERAALDAQTKILVSALNDYTRASTNMSISSEDRQRSIQAAEEIKNYLRSIGVDLTGGTTAPGPPIR